MSNVLSGDSSAFCRIVRYNSDDFSVLDARIPYHLHRRRIGRCQKVERQLMVASKLRHWQLSALLSLP
jgi:hypothetical protein